MRPDLEQQLKSLNRSPASEPDPTWVARVKTKLDWVTENPIPPHVPAFNLRAAHNSWKRLLAFSASVFALLALLMGGAAYAMERATPDQWFYPVKIASEDARRVLATNAIAKAKLELEFADRRVEELTRLAQKKKLDAATAASIQARYQAHVTAALSTIHLASPQAAAALTNDISANTDKHAETEMKLEQELDHASIPEQLERRREEVRTRVRDMLDFARESSDAARFMNENGPDRTRMRLKVEHGSDGKAHVKIELDEDKDDEGEMQPKEWTFTSGATATGTATLPLHSDDEEEGEEKDARRRKHDEVNIETTETPTFRVESRNGTTTIFSGNQGNDNEESDEDEHSGKKGRKFNRILKGEVRLNVNSEQSAERGSVEQSIETNVKSESSIEINSELKESGHRE